MLNFRFSFNAVHLSAVLLLEVFPGRFESIVSVSVVFFFSPMCVVIVL